MEMVAEERKMADIGQTLPRNKRKTRVSVTDVIFSDADEERRKARREERQRRLKQDQEELERLERERKERREKRRKELSSTVTYSSSVPSTSMMDLSKEFPNRKRFSKPVDQLSIRYPTVKSVCAYQVLGEDGELGFEEGEDIELMGVDEHHWAYGRRGKKVGWFPIDYIELSSAGTSSGTVDGESIDVCGSCVRVSATEFCKQCADSYCHKCSETVHRGRIGTHHHVVSFGGAGVSREAYLNQSKRRASISDFVREELDVVDVRSSQSQRRRDRKMKVLLQRKSIPYDMKLVDCSIKVMIQKNKTENQLTISSMDDLRALMKVTEKVESNVVENPYSGLDAPPRIRPLPALDANEDQTIDQLVSAADPTNLYSRFKMIGSGGFSTVYSAREDATRDTVAIKKMLLKDINMNDIKQEVELMKICRHPNIINYIESYKVNEELWIVMEHAKYGSIEDLLKERKESTIPESMIASIILQVLVGLIYIHSINCVHRDIKSDNVLVGADGVVKISDFGFTVQLTKDKQKRKSTVGTTYWQAPEVIGGEPYDHRVDIWSLGVLAWEIAQGVPPYYDEVPMIAQRMIYADGIPPLPNSSRYTSHFQGFINACCQKVENRAKGEDLLRHPWFRYRASHEDLIAFMANK